MYSYFGLQMHFTRDRHQIFLPEAGKNWWEQETCCCALAGIRIIVLIWKNYFGECQRERCKHNKLQLGKCAKSSPHLAPETLTLILKLKDSCSKTKVSNCLRGRTDENSLNFNPFYKGIFQFCGFLEKK